MFSGMTLIIIHHSRHICNWRYQIDLHRLAISANGMTIDTQ